MWIKAAVLIELLDFKALSGGTTADGGFGYTALAWNHSNSDGDDGVFAQAPRCYRRPDVLSSVVVKHRIYIYCFF